MSSRDRANIFLCGNVWSLINGAAHAQHTYETRKTRSSFVVFSEVPGIGLIVDSLCDKNFVKDVIVYESLRARSKPEIVLRLLLNKLKYEVKKGRLPNRFTASGSNIFSQNYIYVLFFFRFLSSVKFYLLDEGLSSYTGRVLDPKYRSTLFKAFANVKQLRKFLPEAVGIFLLKKQFFHNETSFEVRQIRGNLDLNDVADTELITSHLDKNIFLGSNLNSMHNLLTSGAFDKEKYVQFTQYFSRVFSDCVYKPHPSENRLQCREYWVGDILDTEVPWELLCKKLDSSIFILSIFSTACLTPLLMYSKQVKVIFLYKLLGYDLLNSDYVIDKIREHYESLIFIPTTLDELESLISDQHA